MTYWLQELQQKRWEYCNGLDMVKWDGRTSPTPGDRSQGLVARGAPEFLYPHPNASAEKARNVLAIDAAPGELVGEQAASQPAPGPPNSINFSLKQWGAELRNSMSSFRPGRAERTLSESRGSSHDSTALGNNQPWARPGSDTLDVSRVCPPPPWRQELVRLLQQTVRSSQYDKYFAGSRLCDGAPQDTLALLHQKDDQDNLQGYKTQNKFLNKEILELSALRRNAERRERDLMAKVGSGWGGLPSPGGGAAWKPFGNGLVWPWLVWNPGPFGPQADALSAEPHRPGPVWPLCRDHAAHCPSCSLRSEYDIYGFRTVPEDDEEERLVAKVRALDLRSLSLAENQEVSTGVKWENYLAGTMTREMARSPELKSLIRAGIPHEHRSKVWRWCVDLHTRKLEWPQACGEGAAWHLPSARGPAPALRGRGGTWDPHPHLGLCPQVDQRVFRDLMSEKLPRLHAHLEQHKVDYTLITFNWFLVVFVDSVVSDVLFKIWDSFLYEGPKVGLRAWAAGQVCPSAAGTGVARRFWFQLPGTDIGSALGTWPPCSL
ncbi:PREDICTED: TBC1 domain family member 2B [Myotis davidii]|uniref:TBC1 domain family member 2B n=1 Tax=Myotis davidii TaxID=225400 RepID=UPI000767C154|nr:PREDICTED: TBC1 domain family member 2B [Myotis davidii]